MLFQSSSKIASPLFTAVIASSLFLSGCGTIGKIGNVFNRGSSASDTPVEAIVPSSQPGEEVSSLKLSADGMADYNGNYRNDPNNKAFAASPAGAFGVAFGAASMQDAKQAALEKCMQDVVPGDLECIVYDVNGTKVFRPTRLRRVK